MLGRILSLVAALLLASASASAYVPERSIAAPELRVSSAKAASGDFWPAAEPSAKGKAAASACRVWEIWHPPQNLTSSMGFTGYYSDAESGLNYAKARYQLPGIGRFLQVDPWEGDTNRPITLNKYLYANGNPLTFIDPDGRAAHPCSAQPEGCEGYSGYETPAPVQAPRVVRAPSVAEQVQNPPPAPIEGPVMDVPYEGPLTGHQVQRVKMLEDKERARQSSEAFERRATNVLTMLAGPITRDPDSVTGRQRINVIDKKPLSASEQYEAITDAVEFGALVAGPKFVRVRPSSVRETPVVVEGANGRTFLSNEAPYSGRTMRDVLEARYGSGNVTSTTVPPRSGSNVRLAGRQHGKTGVVFDERGYPVFDDHAAFDTRLPLEEFSEASYTGQMRLATQDLHRAIERGEIPASRFTPSQLDDIRRGAERISEYTWHHHQDVGRMQLVPRELHRRTGHVGGESMSQGRQ